jgi:hypothetical protein
MWDALKAKFRASNSGSELLSWSNSVTKRLLVSTPLFNRVMRCNPLPKNLSILCALKVHSKGNISKLPPLWRNFATSLNRRQEFSVTHLIGILDVEER